MNMPFKSICFAFCLSSAWLFTGCAGDRYQQSTGEMVDSVAITAKVKAALVNDPEVKARDIKVKTFRGEVQLSGFVDTRAQKKKAEQIAVGVEGVRKVRNDLIVKSTVP